MIWVLSLCAAGCADFDDAPEPQVLPRGPREISLSPPARIGFEDIEPVGRSFAPLFGSVAALHRKDSRCCAYAPCRGSRSPATVDVASVFAAIEDYAALRRSRIPPDSAEYIVRLSRVNERFADALGQAVVDLAVYDTVFDLGSVRLREGAEAKGIPDLTGEVLKRLR